MAYDRDDDGTDTDCPVSILHNNNYQTQDIVPIANILRYPANHQLRSRTRGPKNQPPKLSTDMVNVEGAAEGTPNPVPLPENEGPAVGNGNGGDPVPEGNG